MRARIPYAVCFVLVAALYLAGGLGFVESLLIDSRFRLTERDASGDLVVVAIDAESLEEIGVWPWPRSIHAQVIDRLLDAGARRIAIDVDFSSRSVEDEDRALADALARGGDRIILPVFKQASLQRTGWPALIYTAPLPEFSGLADLASINVAPGADGLVRRLEVRDFWDGIEIATLPALLAGQAGPEAHARLVDFGVRPDSIARISMADVLFGRFDPAFVAGKQVLIGSTAVELGDQIAVPIYRAIPGVLFQALAYESLVQGRSILQVSPAAVLFVGLLLALLAGPQFARWSWRRGLLAVAGVVAASAFLALGVQTVAPASVDTTPWMLVVLLSYGVSLVGANREQAERIQALRVAAARRRATMRSIVEQSFDGIISLDESGRVQTFSPGAERILGYRESEVVGREAAELFTDSAAQKFAEYVSRHLAGGADPGASQPFEIAGRRADGGTFPMELIVSDALLTASDLPRDRKYVKENRVYICTIRDITQRKVAEQATHDINEQLERRVQERTRELHDAQDELLRKERFATLGRLTATVIHELRNPLGTIDNSAKVIGKLQGMGERLVGPLDRIQRNVERCNRIITELLEYTKVRALKPESTPVDSWIEALLGEIPIPEGIELEWRPGAPGQEFEVDRDWLRRGIINIVENAWQAMQLAGDEDTPTREHRLSVETVVVGGRVEITVRDSGMGIPGEDLPKIFEPLYSTKEFGVGLGLALVKQIVDQHQGKIDVVSKIGAGTEVILWLPLSQAQAKRSA